MRLKALKVWIIGVASITQAEGNYLRYLPNLLRTTIVFRLPLVAPFYQVRIRCQVAIC